MGANIFIGNLDPEVDEKLLYDTFSAFGVILTTPKVKYSRSPLCLGITGFKIASFAADSLLKLPFIFRYNVIQKLATQKDLLL